ncbi:conserved hypothetical protein [Histoplasma capsulatum G186AR]|uniref:RRM domain-containing protein n=2 Tax=Ajellomyces capsulatus TaxID=5037 RepID=C0NSV9_AJECG|nr:uncharacterized protein HCBG_06239 [Histoplasma capsulatum G186AR]EEH05120.1 conserved hypothetical protein [Histoplasma capsulatum G186AR]KAG5305516.1 nonsense-mediated mRNA decay protein [Histoplasma capsulatum]QSS76478.1 nonsense-mediated mRNA decay protein [Histoplasma capsulatum G186AR]
MAPHSPKPSSAGVLPISPLAAQRGSSNKPSPKPAAPQLKVLIRRLPPGLTAQEFVAVLGDEWKVGNGKVDWFRFKEGKVFKDPAKPSRPTRAYLRVTSIPLVDELSEKVRVSAFQDGRNTSRDPILLGPPSLEYAPYPRVPGSRVRKDGRQGTIDLDSDFITFLESLTNPVTKSVADIAADDTREEKPTITPLIQFLKEKRANKGKETSSPARPSRHSRGEAREGKDAKVERVHARKLLSRAEKATPSPGDRPKIERATKQSIKAVNKQTANQMSKKPRKASESLSPKEERPPPTVIAPERRRERGSMSAATKILRRDLGLAPAAPRRRAEKLANSATTEPPLTGEADGAPVHSNEDGSKRTSTKASKEAESTRKPALAKQAKGALQPSAVTGRNTSKSANRPVTPTTVTVSSVSKHNPTLASAQAVPHSTATQAFLKHANPSQGVTEELLVAGFATFGKVVKVEIDKKKGFGYVDFAEPGGLAKAIQASPVQIAQSQVVVLERKSGAAVAQARVNASNRPSQSTMGSAPRVVSSGGGQTPSRPTRRGNRGKGGSKETGVGGGNAGSNAGGGNKIGTSK